MIPPINLKDLQPKQPKRAPNLDLAFARLAKAERERKTKQIKAIVEGKP